MVQLLRKFFRRKRNEKIRKDCRHKFFACSGILYRYVCTWRSQWNQYYWCFICKKYRSYCSICIAGCGFSCQPSLRRGCGSGSCSGDYGNIGRSVYLRICANWYVQLHIWLEWDEFASFIRIYYISFRNGPCGSNNDN